MSAKPITFILIFLLIIITVDINHICMAQEASNSKIHSIDKIQPLHGRAGATMVYDVANNQIVLFGGGKANLGNTSNQNRISSETYLWNEADGWKQLKSKKNPSQRTGHAMAYFDTRKETVLFGGYHPFLKGKIIDRYFSDTWILNKKNKWRKSKAKGPSARRGHSLVYDIKRNYLLLFGGFGYGKTGNIRKLNDTWIFDGKTWKEVNTGGTLPALRYDHYSAFDPNSQMVIIAGGGNNLRDIWGWNGNSWQLLTNSSDIAFYNGTAVSNNKDKEVVFYGGYEDNQYLVTLKDDFNITKNKVFKKQHFVGAPASAYHKKLNKILFFGGDYVHGTHSNTFASRFDNRLLEWNGKSLEVVQDETFPVLTVPTVVHDPAANESMILGGFTYDNFHNPFPTYGSDRIYKFDGDTFIQSNNKGPSSRMFPALCFNPEDNSIMLFGGYKTKYDDSYKDWYRFEPLADMWKWKDGKWTELPVEIDIEYTSPFYNFYHAREYYKFNMIYDYQKSRFVLFYRDYYFVLENLKFTKHKRDIGDFLFTTPVYKLFHDMDNKLLLLGSAGYLFEVENDVEIFIDQLVYGKSYTPNDFLQDVAYDKSTGKFYFGYRNKVIVEPGGIEIEFDTVKKRTGYQMTIIDNYLYIIGGASGSYIVSELKNYYGDIIKIRIK